MELIQIEDICYTVGDRVLLDNACLYLSRGEKICLVGRNGAGKSTFLKILNGDLPQDSGKLLMAKNIIVRRLPQELPEKNDKSVFEAVAEGLTEHYQALQEFKSVNEEASGKTTSMKKLEELHSLVDRLDAWDPDRRVEEIISRMGLPADKKMCELSGGRLRRVALAKALVAEPDILLADEPTNHLDIENIEKLEQDFISFKGCLVFITHDRAFMDKIADRIVEIDRGKLTSWPGNFEEYRRLKEDAIAAEDRQNALFDKKLAEEEVWIRKGVEARRTRNEGRVKALEEMRRKRAERVKKEGKVSIELDSQELTGRKVFDLNKVYFGYDDDLLIENFSIRVFRGEHIGIMGNNGVGKTTLLGLMLGKLQPQRGTVKQGTNLKIGYFDQNPETMKPEETLVEFIGDGTEFIAFNGKEIHALSYLRRFLFPPERSRTKIKHLSGGEKNRAALAKLFTKQHNMLVLDEPTNDLDMEMLDVLEGILTEYDGTVIIVSHDRDFMDRTVDNLIVFEENGVTEYRGGYAMWQHAGGKLKSADYQINQVTKAETFQSPKVKKENGLSNKEREELRKLVNRIESNEKKIREINERMASPDFNSNDFEACEEALAELARLENVNEELTSRWLELEEQRNN